MAEVPATDATTRPEAPAAGDSSVVATPQPAAAGEPQWTDVTARFHSAVSRLLRPGELLHHSSFSLKESMSALELGDPKMDAAMHVPRNIMTFDKALSRGLIVPPGDLTPYQLLDLIDELFACECTSYTGSHLAYTVFTCIYLHRLSMVRAACPLLSAYLLLFLKSLELTRAIVIQADLFTDEEFAYNLGHLRLGDMDVPANFRNGYSTATPVPPTAAALEEAAAKEKKAKELPSGSAAEANEAATAGADQSKELWAGQTPEQLIFAFDMQEREIDKKVAELRAQCASGESEAELLKTPATPQSSDFHVWLLLKNRFAYRRAWYHLNLYQRQPPFHLRSALQRMRPYESALTRELAILRDTIGGTSWREEEAKRKEMEDAHRKLVAELIEQYELEAARRKAAAALANQSAASLPPLRKPEFPKAPEPHLAPRALAYGFDVGMTKCLTQNSPPRQVNMLYRRDAVGLMQEYMSHFAFLHQLQGIFAPTDSSSKSAVGGGTFHDVVNWFESFHALNANILLRSHLWMCLQFSGNKGDVARDPSLTMLDFLFDDEADGSKATSKAVHASPASPYAAVLAPASSRDSLVQLLIKSHARMCPSVLPLAAEAYALEQARQDAGKEWQAWVYGTPFTYTAFLGRCIVPFYAYFKVLLGSSATYRAKVLATDASSQVNLILDWNVLHEDARAIDSGKEFVDACLALEESRVHLPDQFLLANNGAHLRGQHPCLFYHHNTYALVQDQVLHFMSSYLLGGLEQGLYTPRELPIVLWYLEYALDGQVQNWKRAWRNKDELTALQPPLPPIAAGKKKTAGSSVALKGGKLHPKRDLPQAFQPRPRELSFKYRLLEAQHMCARALVQMMEGMKAYKIKVPKPPTSKGDEKKEDGAAAPAAGASASEVDADTEIEIPAVTIPTLDRAFESIWYSHRFAGLAQVRFPHPLTLDGYYATIAQFAPLDPSVILSIAYKSFTHTKEALSAISKEFLQPSAASAAGGGEGAPRERLSVQEVEYVKSMQKVVVSNLMLCLTFAKQHLQAQERRRPFKVEYKFEQQLPTAPFQTLQTTRFSHFPIIVLSV